MQELNKFRTFSSEFAEATGVFPKLKSKFPAVVDEITRLLLQANPKLASELHLFAFDLCGIANKYGRRLNSFIYYRPVEGLPFDIAADYFENQFRRKERLEKATELLSGLIKDLSQMDVDHLKTFISHYVPPTGRTDYDGPLDLLNEIEIARRVICACQTAHSATFALPVKKRGRRQLPYGEATRDLMTLWKTYTGERVASSKMLNNKMTTHGAQFVLLGMKLISSEVVPSNVVTSINNVLQTSKDKSRRK